MADEDDFFSDNDLAAIPANTLEALEQRAILTSTQKQTSQPAAPAPLRKHAHNAASLNRARGSGLNRNLPWRPPQPSRPPTQSHVQIGDAPPPSAPAPPSSDYGLDDEVVNLDDPSMVIQHTSRPSDIFRSSYQSRSLPRHGTKKDVDLEAEAAFAAADAELGSQTFGRPNKTPHHLSETNGNAMDVSAMLARIKELEAEQARLRKAEQAARSEAAAKQGEIAIVRSNQEKDKKQFEARLSVMQKLHAEETARQKAEIEANKKDRERMETDNRFLQHDLAQEAERTKRVTGPRRAPTQQQTPRKSKRTTLGDGFDDAQIQPSPSRSREKAGDCTPKLGNKRKRTANDSPVAALSFTQPQPILRQESTEQNMTTSLGQQAVQAVVIPDNVKYSYIQHILNHRPEEKHERTMEALMRYAFPSKPEKKLATIFNDELSRPNQDDDHLPMKLARICLRLWSLCLEEKYFPPFYLVFDMLIFSLRGEASSMKSKLIEEAIPLCCRTIDFIAIPTARALADQFYASKMDHDALNRLADELDIDSILELLHDLCMSASLNAERNEVFWRTIDFHFVLQTLGKAQHISHITTMLDVLSTSARTTTVGVILEDAEKQPLQERQMVERLTNLLFEVPIAPKDEPAYTEEEILQLRIEVLNVLRGMCLTDHGTLLLTQHARAAGRMVRFLDAQVRHIYSQRPDLGMPNTYNTPHSLATKTINLTVQLLWHIFRVVDNPDVIVQKLNAVHGGWHKFLVCLTRIAFSEQLVYEAGFDDQICEAAHDILDTVLGPEDGEAVQKAMETPRGTKGSGTEKDTGEGEDAIMNDPG